ncbi:hypothetical protein ACLOJK_026861 [Asimina triloba]
MASLPESFKDTGSGDVRISTYPSRASCRLATRLGDVRDGLSLSVSSIKICVHWLCMIYLVYGYGVMMENRVQTLEAVRLARLDKWPSGRWAYASFWHGYDGLVLVKKEDTNIRPGYIGHQHLIDGLMPDVQVGMLTGSRDYVYEGGYTPV